MELASGGSGVAPPAESGQLCVEVLQGSDEVTVGALGLKHGATAGAVSKGSQSRLCKAHLFEAWLSLTEEEGHPSPGVNSFPAISPVDRPPLSYLYCKRDPGGMGRGGEAAGTGRAGASRVRSWREMTASGQFGPHLAAWQGAPQRLDVFSLP